MTILTDGKRTVGICMLIWNGTSYGPDWSNDFFEVGALSMNDDGAYTVQDVAYCIEQAEDWENKRGDYADDGIPDAEERYVSVKDLA